MTRAIVAAILSAILFAAAAPQTATLKIPLGWARQDFGGKSNPDMIGIWLDRTKDDADFIPRLFLMANPVQDPGTLQSAVHDALASFKSSGDTMHASKAQPLCGGRYRGWFFSYTEHGAQLLNMEQTLLVAREMVYTATYVRSAGQREDPDVRKALNSLCVTSSQAG